MCSDPSGQIAMRTKAMNLLKLGEETFNRAIVDTDKKSGYETYKRGLRQIIDYTKSIKSLILQISSNLA